MRIVLSARTSESRACSVGVASGCDSPNAPSTRSRTHSPGVTPRCAASASSFAYSSPVSLVPTDRVRRASPIRRFYKLPASTRSATPQHPRRGDVSPLLQPPSAASHYPSGTQRNPNRSSFRSLRLPAVDALLIDETEHLSSGTVIRVGWWL